MPIAPPFSYASFAEFITRFGEKEALDVSVAKIAKPVEYNEERANAALEDATAHIDSYLGSRYILTALHASPSNELKRHTVNIARFWLAQHRDPELYRFLYEEAIAWCEAAIADGRSLLTGDGVRVPQISPADAGEDGIPSADVYGSNRPRKSFTQEIFHNSRLAAYGTRRRYW
jgi:phage gp36-like protein